MATRPLAERIRGRSRMMTRRAQGRWATEAILRRRFKNHTGYRLDVDSPRTMTEKLFARMVLVDRQRDESITPLVDKYLVRRTIARIVGPEAVVPLLWHGSDANRIPFDSLERPSVLKPTHSTGAVAILRENGDDEQTRRDARGWLRESCYWPSREYQYHNVERALVVEKFIHDGIPHGPLDYSFWCFHGVPHMVELRNTTRDITNFLDVRFEPLDVCTAGTRPFTPTRPAAWDRMLEMAAALSAPFEFVRVDMYDIHGHVYVGELTFTPAGGRNRFSTREWDEKLGALWAFDPHESVLPAAAPDAFRPQLMPEQPIDLTAG